MTPFPSPASSTTPLPTFLVRVRSPGASCAAISAVSMSGGPDPRSLDDRLWVVGELRPDDRDGLVRALRSAGAEPAADATHQELLWWACRLWGEGAAERLDGDFAFVAWDRDARTLLAARDLFGVEPLYWRSDAHGLALSNWPDALLDPADVSNELGAGPELDEEGVLDFLLFDGPGPAEGKTGNGSTCWRGLYRIPPGELRLWRLGPTDEPLPAPVARRYRRLRPAAAGDLPDDGEGLVRAFLELLDRAVAGRRSTAEGDEPLAIFMSGGLDSTAIAALAAAHGPTVAHTLVYRRLLPDLEGPSASAAARHLGIDHHLHVLDDFTFFEGWQELPMGAVPGDPMVDQLYHAIDRRIVRTSGRVLSGWGGDPLLLPERAWWRRSLGQGGLLSTLWRGVSAWWSTGHRPPLGLATAHHRRTLERRSLDSWQAELPSWLDPDLARRTHAAERLRRYALDALGIDALGTRRSESEPVPEGVRPEAWRHLGAPGWGHLFERIHWTGRWGSSPGPILDRRHPFFDLRLVEMALALPTVPWCLSKTVLRRGLAGRLPEAVSRRPKTPQPGDPLHAWAEPPERLWRVWSESAPELGRFVDTEAIGRWLGERSGQGIGQGSPVRQALNLGCWLARLRGRG